jgi:hypothetical protein
MGLVVSANSMGWKSRDEQSSDAMVAIIDTLDAVSPTWRFGVNSDSRTIVYFIDTSSKTSLARALFLGGTALEGPHYIRWNFVSSRCERIEQAKEDWKTSLASVPGLSSSRCRRVIPDP